MGHGRDTCRALQGNRPCSRCGRQGHIASVCLKSGGNKPPQAAQVVQYVPAVEYHAEEQRFEEVPVDVEPAQAQAQANSVRAAYSLATPRVQL